MNIRKVYPKRVGPTTLTTSAVLFFTADKRYAIERWTLTNYSASDATATIHIVPSGSSTADGNKLLGAVAIVANDMTTVPAPIILDVGDTVYALASANSSINLIFHVNDVDTESQ